MKIRHMNWTIERFPLHNPEFATLPELAPLSSYQVRMDILLAVLGQGHQFITVLTTFAIKEYLERKEVEE